MCVCGYYQSEYRGSCLLRGDKRQDMLISRVCCDGHCGPILCRKTTKLYDYRKAVCYFPSVWRERPGLLMTKLQPQWGERIAEHNAKARPIVIND